MTNKSKKLAILGGRPIFNELVPITLPTIPLLPKLKSGYEKILKSGMITNAQNVQILEDKVRKHLGVKHAIALNSCTSGLILIIKALGLKGEIILPSFTFHASAHALIWNGLKPCFVDCDSQTYNIDPHKVEEAITPATSAILAVHIFGNPPDISALEKISQKHNLKLIFDAAHGFGSKYKGKNVGGFGQAESFSLSPTKLVTAGEGGIVTTNDDELARKIRIGRNYGDPGSYDCEFSGFSARLSEFNALLGLESLKLLEENVAKRDKLVQLYHSFLSKVPGISFQKIRPGNRSSWKDFSILIDDQKFGLSRDMLAEALIAENIITKKYFYPPVHRQRAFLALKSNDDKLKNTLQISQNTLSLPLYSHMPAKVVKKICSVICRIYFQADAVRKVVALQESRRGK